MSNAGKPTPPSSDHSPINSHTADQLESPAQFEDPTTVPDVPVAGDVPDLGNADTIAELSQWCNIQRKTVRQLRVHIGDLNGGIVATQQIWDIDEIVSQCLRHLRGHGCGDELIQQLFAAWRTRKTGPPTSLLGLLEKVEEDLSWAGRWANKHRDGKQIQEYRPPLVTADSLPTDLLDAQNAAIYLASIAGSICEIITWPINPYTTDQVIKLLKVVRDKQPTCVAAIQVVAPELRAMKDGPARFAEIVAATAHEVAITFDHDVHLAVLFGAKMDYSSPNQPSSDFSHIRDNYASLQRHFLSKIWPDENEIIAEIKIEAARAAFRRLGDPDPGRKFTPPTHSEDFTSVNWYGVTFQFAKGLQAECVRALWEAWKSGAPTLSEQTIGEKAGSGNNRFRLVHVFKPQNKKTKKRETHPAWETMIKCRGKGVFSLSEKESPRITI